MTSILENLKALNETASKDWSTSLRHGGQPIYGLFPHGSGCATLVEKSEDAQLIALMRNSLPQFLALAEAVEKRIEQATYQGNIHDEMCNSLHHTMACSCSADDVMKALAALKAEVG